MNLLKNLKSYKVNQLYKRKDKFEKDILELLDEKTLMKTTKINQKYVSDENINRQKFEN